MKKNLVVNVIFFLVVGVVIFNFSAKKDSLNPEKYSFFGSSAQWEGKYPPDFMIPLLNGKDFSISETIGKKVIIMNFFATWCVPCAEEMPELSEFYNAHKNEDLAMIGISAEVEDYTVPFLIKHQVPFPVGTDWGDDIQHLYEINSFPVTIIIGADGTIKLFHRGQIVNAEVAFGKIYQEEVKAIKSPEAIDKDTYLKKIQAQSKGKEGNPAMSSRIALSSRMKTIARSLKCPCHRRRGIIACRCDTANEMIETMAKMNIDQMTDEEVIKQLKTKFCFNDD